jgi:hypothetical protein
VSAFESCQSLHALDLSYTQVSDVTALASFQNLHTLDLWGTEVVDVFALESCRNLHTLKFRYSKVNDVSVFSPCQSLNTLDVGKTQVSDVSALASCQSLHTLRIGDGMAGGRGMFCGSSKPGTNSASVVLHVAVELDGRLSLFICLQATYFALDTCQLACIDDSVCCTCRILNTRACGARGIIRSRLVNH